MTRLLTKVKTRMAIHAHRKVRGLLEGEYGSVFKGRSMDFDDLRAYVPGDDVKDLDWKATARSGHTLIKRYVAIRKHVVLLVVDTGRNMAAMNDGRSSKRDLIVLAAGVMGYVAQRHGDLVCLASGDAARTEYLPPGGSTVHLERILRQVHAGTTLASASNGLTRTLDFVARTQRRRMILVVIADDVPLDPEQLRLLRRLAAQHEVLYLSVGDMSPIAPDVLTHDLYDVDTAASLPRFIRRDDQLHDELLAAGHHRLEERTDQLERLGIVSEHLTSEAEVVPALFRLLERQRRARRL